MPFKTVYESDFYRIEVDTLNDLLRAEWLRPVSKSEMVTGGTKLYEALQDSHITNAIADARKLEFLDAPTKDWMSTDFYRMLSQTSLRKLARVLPSRLFPKISLEAVATRAEAQNHNSFAYKNFTDPTEALAWLGE